MEASYIIIILNLIILESLLSVDNAAVLAVMVKDLPGRQKIRALRYGLLGAYFFRGLCLLLATWLIEVIWLKIVAGGYLVYLFISHVRKRGHSREPGINKARNPVFRFFQRRIGLFWSTVILVELVDLAFSIDNVFAAVAFTDEFWVIMTGVGIGIVTMRIVAGKFVRLMERFPGLEHSAYIAILFLGLKLAVSGVIHYIPGAEQVQAVLDDHITDLVFSGAILVLFLLPLLRFRRRGRQPESKL